MMTNKDILEEEKLMRMRLIIIQNKLLSVSDLNNQKEVFDTNTWEFFPPSKELVAYRTFILKSIAAALIILKLKQLKKVNNITNEFFYKLTINCMVFQLEDFFNKFIKTKKIILNSYLQKDTNIFFRLIIESEVKDLIKELSESMTTSNIFKLIPLNEPEVDDETGSIYEYDKRFFSFYKKLYCSSLGSNEWNKNEIVLKDPYEINFKDWIPPDDLPLKIDKIFNEI